MYSLFELLVNMLNLPFELWKKSNEDSGIGASEFEQEAENFWAKIALIGTVIVVSVGLICWSLLK